MQSNTDQGVCMSWHRSNFQLSLDILTEHSEVALEQKVNFISQGVGRSLQLAILYFSNNLVKY